MSNTKQKLVTLIADTLDLDEKNIHENTNLIEDLGADSLDIVELVMAVEEEFSCAISDDDVQQLKTVGDILKYINSHS